jgi:ATP-binding cassette subfamily E protein 1
MYDVMNNMTVENYIATQLLPPAQTPNNGVALLTHEDEGYHLLEIDTLLQKQMSFLSGGELQKLFCWITSKRNANVFIFDEPSNFLDGKQRLNMCKVIRNLVKPENYVLVIDHDISMLDYVADVINIIYGKASAYGIVSTSMTVANAINNYLDGFIPVQNIRFRDVEYNFREISSSTTETQNLVETIELETTQIVKTDFTLQIPKHISYAKNGVNIIVGENGSGKTTYLNYLIEHHFADKPVSYKQQIIGGVSDANMPDNNVHDYLNTVIGGMLYNVAFSNDVMKPFAIKKLFNKKLHELSGGELQKVNIVCCLGKVADVYVLDEPSANLDIESRLKFTKMLKNFIMKNEKQVFLIEHDVSICVNLGTDMNSKLTIVEKVNATTSIISKNLPFSEGINEYLKILDITMRLGDKFRPRINKKNSRLDDEQKKSGNWYGI